MRVDDPPVPEDGLMLAALLRHWQSRADIPNPRRPAAAIHRIGMAHHRPAQDMDSHGDEGLFGELPRVPRELAKRSQ